MAATSGYFHILDLSVLLVDRSQNIHIDSNIFSPDNLTLQRQFLLNIHIICLEDCCVLFFHILHTLQRSQFTCQQKSTSPFKHSSMCTFLLTKLSLGIRYQHSFPEHWNVLHLTSYLYLSPSHSQCSFIRNTQTTVWQKKKKNIRNCVFCVCKICV